jgi:prepilin-type N-terminal cleavage/methylation domain-containing protein
MSSTMTKRAGFTLIELTITVAIIGILSATAIGLFKAQQLRAKRTEAMTNVEGIGKMERAYFGENGIYPAALVAAPAGLPGTKQNWDALALATFGTLGFQAEGSVWFIYDVNADSFACACPSGGCFTATAYGDSDLDGRLAVISAFHADSTGVVCPVLTAVPPIATPPNDSTGPVLDQVVDIYAFDTMFGTPPRADDY